MNCFNCGASIRETARFCPFCGQDQSQKPEVVEEACIAAEAVEEAVAEVAAEEILEEVAAQAPVEAPEPIPEPVSHPVPEVTYAQPATPPALQLPNGRSLWKMILLGLLTFGIYPMVVYSQISVEINMVASRHDGKRTIHFMWVTFLSALTMGVYAFVWIHGLCNRIGDELTRRGIRYRFSAATFWLWNMLYPLIGAVVAVVCMVLLPMAGLDLPLVYVSYFAVVLVSLIGPFVYMHKNMKAMNLVNTDYNEKG